MLVLLQKHFVYDWINDQFRMNLNLTEICFGELFSMRTLRDVYYKARASLYPGQI